MKKTKNLIIPIAAISIIAFVAYTIWLISKPLPLEIQGEVEATQVNVASKLVGRLDSLAIHKGQEVKKGDVLFTIQSPELEARMSQAKAAKQAAEAQKLKAETGARTEDIQAAFNNWKKAEAAAEYAKKTFSRIKNLHEEGVLPAQKKDEAETRMIAAVETEKAAKSIYEKAQKGAREEDKAAAGALVKQAEGVITEVSSYLSEKEITAPVDGEVANIIVDRGELVPAGYPVVTIVDLEDIWITFNIREDLLPKIKKGTILPARFPAIGEKEIDLKVTYINALGDFATWTATKTSGDFDMKTFEVHAVPVENTPGLRPGMSALVNWEKIN